MKIENTKIGIIGLGYVGLPLALEFGKKYSTVGFDINIDRIKELKDGFDRTKEAKSEDLTNSKLLKFTSEADSLNECNVYIITVPTPIDNFKKPDLTPILSASRLTGGFLKKGDVVIYESTVYPGCTEEDCVPILENVSGLSFNQDFYCGYSPERINPGDKERTLTNIVKITSGSTPEIANFVDDLYNSILQNGTFKANSIKVAEAAKLIENCQRDVNISFVNELALIFERMNIDTNDVLEAAGSKWNFLKFKPGLVGGHCIGVDPYYMIHKAESLGYFPALIGAGRRINDNMGIYVANKLIKLMIQNGLNISSSKILLLGITFKENCPDIRNSRVIDIYNELKDFGLEVDVYDPWANKEEVAHEYEIDLINMPCSNYQAVVLTVAHNSFLELDYSKLIVYNGVIYDIKAVLPNTITKNRL
ncbi:nucleotide sugar dehydrogenase [Lacihabitans sp. CS3-21]|uniref:nucleotide sugar dehydrogenase n=1 Tax=Lacihabitans sp. CS3-21 TaxID=2487332 RepID=UPI0020CBEA57|nr:nucleotide sugar dehydrogenase [Lacihabitans sp. CS3-21]MCP9747570.1 nucleotide sugar dehydrogenase [Lacihabitans sp. CS3-21]